MTSSVDSVDGRLLERLGRRLAVYVQDSTLKESRLDRVLSTLSIQPVEAVALRQQLLRALQAAGIDVVDDGPPTDLPAPVHVPEVEPVADDPASGWAPVDEAP